MNYTVEFHRPQQLPDPFPAYKELISTLNDKIGKEQLSNRIELISLEWAIDSGYFFKVIDNRHVFVHVSLNPNDFN